MNGLVHFKPLLYMNMPVSEQVPFRDEKPFRSGLKERFKKKKNSVSHYKTKTGQFIFRTISIKKNWNNKIYETISV